MISHAATLALASAALFGAATPLAKTLLGDIHPTILAGLLYCGAGIGIALLRRVPFVATPRKAEAALGSADLPWLAGSILAGGVAGPVLLMAGLAHTEASATSLLLTLEGVATALIAWFAFREPFDHRIAVGMACLVAGALVLAWTGTPTVSSLAGPAAIVAACVAWGLDNNLMRKISLADPLQIVEIKGLVAGPIALGLGLTAGGALPSPPIALSAGVVGVFGYGISLALFVLALRELGSARTAAYFSTAPFLGTLVAIAFLNEPVTPQLALAGALMAVGVWLHLTEHHEHEHEHAPLEHEHAHVHDAHHQHGHGPNDPPGEPHTHRHRHGRLRHSHAHMPDMHHTHQH